MTHAGMFGADARARTLAGRRIIAQARFEPSPCRRASGCAWQNLWNTTYKAAGKSEFTDKKAYKTWTDVEVEGLGEDDVMNLKVTTGGAGAGYPPERSGVFD